MTENNYQATLISSIKKMLPGCIVSKLDANQIQGIPDLVIFYKNKYAILEVKISKNAIYQPNQEYYLNKFGKYVYSETIYPENEKEILDGLQQALRS